jgi:hypothetical protein
VLADQPGDLPHPQPVREAYGRVVEEPGGLAWPARVGLEPVGGDGVGPALPVGEHVGVARIERGEKLRAPSTAIEHDREAAPARDLPGRIDDRGQRSGQ